MFYICRYCIFTWAIPVEIHTPPVYNVTLITHLAQRINMLTEDVLLKNISQTPLRTTGLNIDFINFDAFSKLTPIYGCCFTILQFFVKIPIFFEKTEVYTAFTNSMRGLNAIHLSIDSPRFMLPVWNIKAILWDVGDESWKNWTSYFFIRKLWNNHMHGYHILSPQRIHPGCFE